jgi:hypothetical protein
MRAGGLRPGRRQERPRQVRDVLEDRRHLPPLGAEKGSY